MLESWCRGEVGSYLAQFFIPDLLHHAHADGGLAAVGMGDDAGEEVEVLLDEAEDVCGGGGGHSCGLYPTGRRGERCFVRPAGGDAV